MALPETFNIPNTEVLLDNVVAPLTFNDDKHVVLFCKVVIPVIYKELKLVLLNIVVLVAFKLFIDNVELVLNEFIFDNNVHYYQI